MLRLLLVILLVFTGACAEPDVTASIDLDNSALSTSQVSIEVYLSEAAEEYDCDKILDLTNPREEMNPSLVFESLAQFEAEGFATIQIDHLPASKKMLLLVLAIDLHSSEIVAQGCANNIEVEKGSTRDIHLVLRSMSDSGDNE